jgi:hypothetical protein
MVSLFTSLIASSLVIVGAGFVGSAFAADTRKVTNQDRSSYPSFPTPTVGATDDGDRGDDDTPPAVLREDKPNSPMSHEAHSSDHGPSPAVLCKDKGHHSESTISKSSNMPEKDLKTFSICRSNAAEDGDVTPAEVMDCFHQVP